MDTRNDAVGAAALAPAPGLWPMARIALDVGPLVTLGALATGERRYVPLGGGTVEGPELNGRVVEGGVDWQLARADGALEIAAHYVLELEGGALVEVRSDGVRYGPPEVMRRLAAGEAVAPDEYYFRTAMRFATGAPDWAHLNTLLAVARGRREAHRVVLEVYRLG